MFSYKVLRGPDGLDKNTTQKIRTCWDNIFKYKIKTDFVHLVLYRNINSFAKKA